MYFGPGFESYFGNNVDRFNYARLSFFCFCLDNKVEQRKNASHVSFFVFIVSAHRCDVNFMKAR